jgi:hypothetical protein
MPTDIEHVIEELQARVSKGIADINRYERLVAETRHFIEEANITLKTLRSLGVAASADKPASNSAGSAPSQLNAPEMIYSILGEMDVVDEGLTPSEIMERMKSKFNVEPDPKNVRPALWRITEKQHRLERNGSRYRLPQKNKATDLLSRREQSEAFDQPEQSREAGSGGGT